MNNHELKNRKKIAYCIPGLHYPSGMERVLTMKANYLSDICGYEIHIILTEGGDKIPYYKLSPHIQIHQLNINFDATYHQPILQRFISYFFKQLRFRSSLSKCLYKIKPDITISLLRRDINFINKINDGSIKIGEIHFNKSNYRDFTNYHLPTYIQKIIQQLWMNQLIRKLKKLKTFIVLSEEDKVCWTELKNVQVIYNPLSFYPDTYSSCERKQVIAVGRYVPQKGFDRLILAWDIVAKKHKDWTLRIYGDGMRTELQNMINERNLGETCILEHTTSNIVEKYIKSSIFVLSSRFEGFGMVLTEAMACGVPPISFTCPCGPKDIIKNNEDGILVENGNIQELADKICFLIENEDVRKEMGRQARVNVRRFSIEKIGKQWDNLFSNSSQS